jgi:N-succinyldiaminopimelate aminotransferase
MNPDLQRLQAYPFERLAALKQKVSPPTSLAHIPLSIGEPKHPAPQFVIDAITAHLADLSSYPLTKGMLDLRQAIADWLCNRFGLAQQNIDAEKNILPVSGTREALFAIAQAVIEKQQQPLVLMPNPFYQIYEGAALLAGAEPWFMNTTHETDFLPDFDSIPAKVWQQTQLVYVCSPGNPTGRVMPAEQLKHLIDLADKYDFVIASDECYSELYFDEANPPVGLLQACHEAGNHDYKHCIVFHSLSKRSNLPGLRSGFVAGDAKILQAFLRYRTYQGCAMSPPYQWASIAAWSDEKHVQANRNLYRDKFAAVLEILSPVMSVNQPDAGFYLWPKLDMADDHFAQQLFAEQNVTVLPGQYLSRMAHGISPGEGYIRMALVAELDNCIEAAQRIRHFLENC